MHVAREDLHGRDERGHPHRHREHDACVRVCAIFQQVPRADRAHHERRGEIGGDHGVDEAVGEAGVEDDRPPAFTGEKLAVLAHDVTDRGLHPGIDAENPEGRDERADRDHQRGGKVKFLPNLVHAEQHHAEETRFEEEGGEHFIGHERADHRTGLVRKHRPVGAELIRHDDARDDAHREGDREDLQPVAEEIEILLPPGLQPKAFEHGEVARQPDREGGKDEVEADRERELDTRQQHGIHGTEH